jgi:hypothetical protein
MLSFFTVSNCYHFYVKIFPCTYFVLFDVIIYCSGADLGSTGGLPSGPILSGLSRTGFMKKSRIKKSRDTVPLRKIYQAVHVRVFLVLEMFFQKSLYNV